MQDCHLIYHTWQTWTLHAKKLNFTCGLLYVYLWPVEIDCYPHYVFATILCQCIKLWSCDHGIESIELWLLCTSQLRCDIPSALRSPLCAMVLTWAWMISQCSRQIGQQLLTNEILSRHCLVSRHVEIVLTFLVILVANQGWGTVSDWTEVQTLFLPKSHLHFSFKSEIGLKSETAVHLRSIPWLLMPLGPIQYKDTILPVLGWPL